MGQENGTRGRLNHLSEKGVTNRPLELCAGAAVSTYGAHDQLYGADMCKLL